MLCYLVLLTFKLQSSHQHLHYAKVFKQEDFKGNHYNQLAMLTSKQVQLTREG